MHCKLAGWDPKLIVGPNRFVVSNALRLRSSYACLLFLDFKQGFHNAKIFPCRRRNSVGEGSISIAYIMQSFHCLSLLYNVVETMQITCGNPEFSISAISLPDAAFVTFLLPSMWARVSSFRVAMQLTVIAEKMAARRLYRELKLQY